MTNIVATYHKDCPDGTTAAAALLAAHPEAQTFALPHNHTPEELQAVLAMVDADTDAYTLDCVLGATELAAKAKTLTIIDHHVSIEKEIKGFAQEARNVTLVFDTSHSGSGLAWPYFHPTTPTPELINLIEDVDLWNWKYGERSRYAATFVGIYKDNPQKVVELFTTDIESIIARGKDMAVYEDQIIAQYLKRAEPVWVMFGEHRIPLYNTPHFDSYIGNVMSEKHGCVSGVFDIRGNKVRLSFRSKEGQTPTALDIAQSLGGGGHKHAAGASATFTDFIKMMG